jgi:hypothetical protein
MSNDLMYSMSVPVFVKMLGNLSAVLDKAVAHAEARKIDPSVLVNARLFPDMFPLTSQVRIASDHAKGAAARLSGSEPPKFEDNETNFAELKARIARTIDYVKSVDPAGFRGSDERVIELKLRGGLHRFNGAHYLAHVALPNFYFHVTTAYDILRHNGVEIGKADYIGPL